MQAIVESFTLCGIEAVPVEVQVSVDAGYPTTTIVGLPDKSVRESLDRIHAAFHSSGFAAPDRRVTVNLAPAELRKEGASFDLAIALGILAAADQVPTERLLGLPVAGELALDGSIRPVRGALAMALAASRMGRRILLLPAGNQAEASDIQGLTVTPLRNLADTVNHLANSAWDPAEARPVPSAVNARPPLDWGPPEDLDLAQVRGQTASKRALEIAAAGGHNLLLVGPPGAGKTLLAQRLPGVLPGLSHEEALEVTLIHSVAGLLREGTDRIRRRPFRSPHHTVSGPGLVGGGAIPKPGEVSLAHCGVLFLDEMPEFRAPVLNLLRQPLEDGSVRLVRSGHAVRFPCRCMLVGAMNPCPCGFLGHPRKPCRCTPHQIKLYRGRIGGPLLDRIDLHIEVPALSARELTRGMSRTAVAPEAQARDGRDARAGSTDSSVRTGGPAGSGAFGDSSAVIRARVEAARVVQTGRFAGRAGIHCNAQMGIPEIEEHCRIDDATRAFLQKAIESLSLSARAAHRSLRVARTIADLAGSEGVQIEHVAEAVQYQEVERAGFGE